jgi:hypothetical protein
MKLFLQIFATKIGWLGITLLLAVIFGYKASKATEVDYMVWYNLFRTSMIYPTGLLIAQLLYTIINTFRK